MTAPAPLVGARLDLLKSLGFAELQHDSHVPFLSHLVGTRRLLGSWGERPALCDAGLFHSVYGTEYFEPDRIATREDVVAIIGAEAERIAWLWCAIRRDTIDVAACSVLLRDGDVVEPLTSTEVRDLATLWAADTVEQVERMEPGERTFSNGLLTVVAVASEAAQRALDAVRALLA
ncbi:MAG TPA: hypothetical protein VL856_02705 [Acidimicrobiia bacterium]|jgi:hypothetical protein|nr:hypothetical protein [Acidimicrobiia bacterium]